MTMRVVFCDPSCEPEPWLEALRRHLPQARVEAWADGAELTWIYDHGEVLERKDGEDSVSVKVRLSERDASRVRRRLAN